MKEFKYVVTDPEGIHARPAGMLVKAVKEFSCEEVKDLLDEDEVVTAKDYEIETGEVSKCALCIPCATICSF